MGYTLYSQRYVGLLESVPIHICTQAALVVLAYQPLRNLYD